MKGNGDKYNLNEMIKRGLISEEDYIVFHGAKGLTFIGSVKAALRNGYGKLDIASAYTDDRGHFKINLIYELE